MILIFLFSGVSAKLTDDRYHFWAKPDVGFVNRYGFSLRPTNPVTIYR